MAVPVVMDLNAREQSLLNVVVPSTAAEEEALPVPRIKTSI